MGLRRASGRRDPKLARLPISSIYREKSIALERSHDSVPFVDELGKPRRAANEGIGPVRSCVNNN